MTARGYTRREFLKKSAKTALGATATALGATALASPLLGGCGPVRQPRAAVEIPLAASAEEVPDRVIADFNWKFAPYHVTRVAVSQAKLQAMLVEKLAAGTAPAVVVLPALKLARLGQRGALRDLSGLFASSQEAQGAELFGVDGYFTSGEQRWGMALAWSPDYLVWANTQLWQAAGVDVPARPLGLEEWRQLSARLSAVQVSGLPVFGTDFHFDFPALLWLAETLDPPARLFSADGRKLKLKARPDFVEAVRFVLDWKKEGGIPFRRSTDLLKSNLPECS